MLCVTYTGYERIVKNLVAITRSLKLNEGAKDDLTLHYIAHKWLDASATPSERDLAKLALMKIEQDPKQYDVFLEMLRDTEGMSLLLAKITGELRCLNLIDHNNRSRTVLCDIITLCDTLCVLKD